MANPHKGEVELKVGEQSYTLRFSIDAICRLEASVGKGVPLLMEEMSNAKTLTLAAVREVLHAGLHEHHPDIDLKAAGEFILSGGGMAVVMMKINEALQTAFPQAEAAESPRPPKAPRPVGTGRRS